MTTTPPVSVVEALREALENEMPRMKAEYMGIRAELALAAHEMRPILEEELQARLSQIDAARAALPLAEKEAEVRATMLEALEGARKELEGYHTEFYGEDYNNPKLNAAIQAAKEVKA